MQSIYHNFIHIYHIENIGFYTRLYFMFLSLISVVSYNRGMNQNINFRNVGKKDFMIYDKCDYSQSKDKNIISAIDFAQKCTTIAVQKSGVSVVNKKDLYQFDQFLDKLYEKLESICEDDSYFQASADIQGRFNTLIKPVYEDMLSTSSDMTKDQIAVHHIHDLKNKTNKGIDITESEVVETMDTINRQVDDIKNLVDEFSNFARMPAPNMQKYNMGNKIIG